MAKPQLEDGFTRIAHEIIEVTASAGFSGQEHDFLLILWRFTFGWRTTWATWNNSAWAEGMGVTKHRVSKIKNKLLEKKVIRIKDDQIRFNKDWKKWSCPIGQQDRCPQRLQLFPSKTTGVVTQDYKRKRKPKKKKGLKGGKDKKDRKIYSSTSDEMLLAEYLFKKITNVFRDRERKEPKVPDFQEWAKHFDYMIRLDGIPREEIRAMVQVVTEDKFWQTNILSPKKLRAQWEQLTLKLGDKMKDSVHVVRDQEYFNSMVEKIYDMGAGQGWSGQVIIDKIGSMVDNMRRHNNEAEAIMLQDALDNYLQKEIADGKTKT